MPAPYILPIPVPNPGGNIQRSEDTSGGNRESGPNGRPTSRPTERPAGRYTVRRGRDGQPIPGSRGESGRSPSPFIPSDPYSPESTSGRQSETRRNEGASSSDPDSVIPDRGPGSDQDGMRAGEGLHTIPEKEMSIEARSILADPREIQQGGLDD